jgi:hypothetical protein
MLRAAIIQPDQSYTFADYFKLNFAPQDILAYFKVSLQRRSLNLPRYSGSSQNSCLSNCKEMNDELPRKNHNRARKAQWQTLYSRNADHSLCSVLLGIWLMQ